MRKTIFGLVTAAILLISVISARAGNFGLGVIIGEPTGLAGKLWLTKTTAVDGALAWSLKREANFLFHADYLYHNFGLIKIKKGTMPVYYGFGGRVKFRHESKLGIRIPVGIEYLFPKAPFDIFFEIAPIVNLLPSTSADLNAALGLRFFFP